MARSPVKIDDGLHRAHPPLLHGSGGGVYKRVHTRYVVVTTSTCPTYNPTHLLAPTPCDRGLGS